MLLCCRNSSNTAQNILRNGKCTLNFIDDKPSTFKEAVKLSWPGDKPEEKMAKCKFKLLDLKITYTVSPNGELTVETEVDNHTSVFLPRFGYELIMPENSEMYSYFGYGPQESYVDMHLSSRMGLFKGKVSDNIEHYVYPQENNSHYNTLSASVKSIAGHGLAFENEESFSFRASHYNAEQLTKATHDYELIPSELTYVNIDYKLSGIGSNSCGPELAEEYRLNEKNFNFSFKIKPTR